MSDNMYKLAGTVKIPEDKKKSFNENVLKILYLCGIRKTSEMELAGRKISVVEPAAPDENGLVTFDYSIFEKMKREVCTYNMRTCELVTPDRGYREFGVTMNLVMVLLESFSETPCYLVCDGKPVPVDGYAALIKGLLGITIFFPNREKLWDMFLVLKNTEGCEAVSGQDVFHAYPFDLCRFCLDHVAAVIDIDRTGMKKPEEPIVPGGAIEAINWIAIKWYAYETMLSLIREGKDQELESFLENLLCMELPSRRELAGNGTAYGRIAEASLYLLPSVMVKAYAEASGQDFWEVWNKAAEGKAYGDTLVEAYDGNDGDSELKEFPFRKVILRKNDDEFLEFWRGETMDLSDGLEQRLRQWSTRFKELAGSTESADMGTGMETCLAQVIGEMYEIWGCRLVDGVFVREFLRHPDDGRYMAALRLLREMMDEDTVYFPELTKRQANRWIIRRNRDRSDITAMSAFQSLLINHAYRQEILGF